MEVRDEAGSRVHGGADSSVEGRKRVECAEEDVGYRTAEAGFGGEPPGDVLESGRRGEGFPEEREEEVNGRPGEEATKETPGSAVVEGDLFALSFEGTESGDIHGGASGVGSHRGHEDGEG
jgi:hypothetical protein